MHPKLNAKTDLQVDPNLNIQTNVSLLNQIVSNILSNAYTHAFQDREDNQIQISASIEQGFVNISIQNNGVAIPPKSLNICSSLSLPPIEVKAARD